MMMFGFGWLVMLVMVVGMLLGLAVLVLLVWALLRWLQRGSQVGALQAPAGHPRPPAAYPPDRTPLDVLRERYARGEIDTATFEEMRHRLEANDPDLPNRT